MTKKHEDMTKRQKISRYIGLRDTEMDIGLRDIELIDTEINISLNKSKRHRDRGKF